MARLPVAEGLFTGSISPGSISLARGRPAVDREPVRRLWIVTFPAQDSCPRCASTAMAEHLLPRRGRLWAWTTQDFPPPSPPYTGPTGRDFVPFGVGFVELRTR